ncbi:MAG: NADP-dependent oxidoreductase [Mucilaginibacter sp.]|uniref:NADP-dependent oxidoreductase n=1 Tax=Mucilaginibacter sp. TaxID=1882438 RepID=UPI003264C22E
MNNVINLKNRPLGKPGYSDFDFIIEPMPQAGRGKILLKTLYVSIDPYLRGRMNDSKSYASPFELNKPMVSGIVAEVTQSEHPGFNKGDFVSGMLQWKEYQLSDGEKLLKIDPEAAPLTTYLGVLGMTGLTAYFGITVVGKPRPGETLLVSGAAGAVGSIAGQIGKIMGCRVVGITGHGNKARLLKTKFGFDDAINYRDSPDITAAVASTCPNGVDVYFDNVGGAISDAVVPNLNKFARIPVCGSISLYNLTGDHQCLSMQSVITGKSITMQGFLVSDYASEFPKATKQLAAWIKEGKLTYSETIYEGFRNIPQALIDLFEGKNEGKMIVKI